VGNAVSGPALVSGEFLCPPTSYAPPGQTVFTVTGTTLEAFSSASVNTGNFTAPPSGSVEVTVSCVIFTGTSGDSIILGLVEHGTLIQVGDLVNWNDSASGVYRWASGPIEVTGLIPGQTYNLDLAGANGTAGVATSIAALGTQATGAVRGAPVTMAVRAV
jgi:hypothetical protein